MTTTTQAYTTLTEHRHYRYRGCAPDPDQPGRAAGDPTVPVDAWAASTADGGESQRDRLAREKAAKTICARCPVIDACRTYANTETAGGDLVEPEGIWGGQLALERHRARIARRTGTPHTIGVPADAIAAARSPQKLRLLRALARETDTELVAYRAGIDVRTSNWQRAALCTLLGLDKETATREQLLTLAQQLGLLPAGLRIAPDGRWPLAAAPTTDGARQRRLAPTRPVQLTIPGLPAYPRGRRTPTQAPPRPQVRLRLLATPPATPAPLPLPYRTLEPAA